MTSRVRILPLTLAVLAVLALATMADALSVSLSYDYPERHSVPGQFAGFGSVHAVGVPRGGTFEVVAEIDGGARTTDVVVTLDISPSRALRLLDIDVVRAGGRPPWDLRQRFTPLEDDGPDRHGSRTVWLGKVSGVVRVVWTFKNKWEVPLTVGRYEFTAAVRGHGADTAGATLSIPLSISCSETTLRERIHDLARHPFVTDEVVGHSFYGREIHWMVVTDPHVPLDQKRTLLIFAAIHGNEGLGVEAILDFVYLLLTDPARSHYLREFVLHIIPVQNPDGHEWLSWYSLDFASGAADQQCTKPSVDGKVPAVLSHVPSPRDLTQVWGEGGPCGVDINFGYPSLTRPGQPEALASLEGIRRYASTFHKPVLVWTHQWGEFQFMQYAQVTLKHDPALDIDMLGLMNYLGDQLDMRLADYGLPQIIERAPEVREHEYWVSNPNTGADTRGYARSYMLAYHNIPNFLFELPYWNRTLIEDYLEHPYILWSRNPAERVPSPIPHRPYKLQLDYLWFLLDGMLLHIPTAAALP